MTMLVTKQANNDNNSNNEPIKAYYHTCACGGNDHRHKGQRVTICDMDAHIAICSSS